MASSHGAMLEFSELLRATSYFTNACRSSLQVQGLDFTHTCGHEGVWNTWTQGPGWLILSLLWKCICRKLLFCCLFCANSNKQATNFWFHAAFETFCWNIIDSIIANEVSSHSKRCCWCSSALKEHVFSHFQESRWCHCLNQILCLLPSEVGQERQIGRSWSEAFTFPSKASSSWWGQCADKQWWAKVLQLLQKRAGTNRWVSSIFSYMLEAAVFRHTWHRPINNWICILSTKCFFLLSQEN